MDVPVIVAIISAAAGLVASALTFFLTNKMPGTGAGSAEKMSSYP